MDSKWTRFSDAMPTGPFYGYNPKEGEVSWIRWDADEANDAQEAGQTHWHPAQPLPEPPREETQLERDNDKINELILKADDMGGIKDLFRATARSLLAWERAEVAKMLPNPKTTPMCGPDFSTIAERAIAAIRARVGGGKP